MRHTIVLFFLAMASAASAQSPFEYADQRSSAVSYIGCARAGNTWVVCGSAGGEDLIGSPRFAQGFDADGTPTWQTDLVGSTMFMIPTHMIGANGGHVLVAGPHDGCDVPPPTSLLMELDGLGGVVWAKDLWLGGAQHLDQAPDGRILISASNNALITDQFGDSLTTVGLDSLGWPSVWWMDWDTDSTLLAVRYGGILERRTMQADLLATSATPLPTLQDAVNWRGKRLALEQSGDVHVLDADLVEVNVIPLGSLFTKGRFIRGDGSLWVIGNQTAVELDSTMAILRTVDLDPSGTFDDEAFLGFAVDGDTIAMAGTPSTAQRPAGLIRTVMADGSVANHDEDVSISIESIDTTWYQLIGGLVDPLATVTVRITNEGSGIVDEVVVNHFSFYWICEVVEKTLHLSGLNLAPGASFTAEMDSLWLAGWGPWYWIEQHLDQELCISVMSPNALYDRDQSDNLACDTAHIVLGLDELHSAAPFTVIHDPTSDRLEVRFFSPSTSLMDLRVLDMSGKVHSMVTLSPGITTYSLNTGGIAAGLYALDVLSPRAGRWSVKWVRP